MNEEKNFLLKEKLIKMETYLKELRELKPNTYEQYLADKTVKYAIERLFQLIIDLAMDINNMIIKLEGAYPAADYFNSFIDLIELKVLEKEFAYNIAPSTGIRNRLVHEYEKINDKIVYESIDKTNNYYLEYMKNILYYLDGNIN